MDERLKLAYDESLRAIDVQQAALADVRARAAQLVVAASVATSVLGALVQDTSHRVDTWSIVALVTFGLLLAICGWIFIPRRGWRFVTSATILIDQYIYADLPADIDEIHRELALHMERHWDANQDPLNKRMAGLQVGALLLAVSVVSWIIGLLTG